MSTPSPDATKLVAEGAAGNSNATSRLMPLVFSELRSLAAKYLRRERPDHTLEPTELVHEAYVKLVDQRKIDWQGRTHFFAVAACAVRQVLVDHARSHNALKRGRGFQRVTFHGFDQPDQGRSAPLLALDEALTELGKLSPRQKEIVELRFFGGLNHEEIAAVLNLSPRTVKESWRVARAWLIRHIREEASA